MPFFHRKTEEERQQEEVQRQRRAEEQGLQQASLDALAQGSIPVQAQRRLEEFRHKEGFFTSDLTVNEFLLTRQAGLQPLSQVMGSSIYHVGWQYTPIYNSRELEVVTRALNHSRELALGRLTEEAHRVGAHAVIGVHVTRGEYDFAEDLVEFNVVGTAVRIQGQPPTNRPGLTNLSGQDFWKLTQSGYWPVGVVAASTVYYVVATWMQQMRSGWFGGWANQELQDFTQGLYIARHIAMNRLHVQAEHLGASGIVGMEIEQEEEEHEVQLGNDQERTDMIFTFHAIGTAIAEIAEQPAVPSIYSAVSLER
jgi:uncharacterized protein YbjQ (UPF0145 family)